MKRIWAWMLAAVLLFSLATAAAEEADDYVKYEKLTVSTTTPFSGNFLSEALGNNISDQDVRRLIHGYHLVIWDSATGSYQFNDTLLDQKSTSEDGMTFIFMLKRGLRYNDGSPVTARDYAFSLLLQGSPALKEAAGGQLDLSRILGGRDYQEGKTKALQGFRILGDYQFALTIAPEYTPYFYQLQALDVAPLPIAVIAPDCSVEDEGGGAMIEGAFDADLLEETLLNPVDGYLSQPSVTCGPYMLTGRTEHAVELSVNPEYIGDEHGVKPSIPKIVLQEGDADKVIGDLAAGRTDLVVRCLRGAQIRPGMALAATQDFGVKAYSRSGISFISFCAEKGATQDLAVRQALTLCLDRATLTEQYTEAYGTPVDGMYGIGQWMFMMANGTLVPEEGEEENWADLSLEQIPKYAFDPAAAQALLESSGWEMDRDGVLSKAMDGQDISLRLKLIYPEGNGVGPMLQELYIPRLNEIGIELEMEAVPMPELLERYYGRAERDCDMILLGSNFGDVYDPSGEYDEEGTSRLTGITDPELRELAIALRSTDPGNAPEYCRRWLRYQARLMEIAADIPLYSDAYFDFHISALQQYEPGRTAAWSLAVPSAVLSDFAAEDDGDFGLEDSDGLDETDQLEGDDLE